MVIFSRMYGTDELRCDRRLSTESLRYTRSMRLQLRTVAVLVMAVGCGGGSKTSGKTAVEVSRDGPAFGLYELDKEHMRPQILALLDESGASRESVERDIAALEPGRAWLLLDRELPPMLIFDVDRTEVRQLELSRHLQHFKLAARRLKEPAICVAEAADSIQCDVVVDEFTLQARLLRVVDKPQRPLPAPGIYEIVTTPEQDQKHMASMRKWLAEGGISGEEAEALIRKQVEGIDVLLIAGDRWIRVAESIALIGGEGEEKQVELKLDARKSILVAKGDRFRVKYDHPGPETECAVKGTGFQCTIDAVTIDWKRRL